MHSNGSSINEQGDEIRENHKTIYTKSNPASKKLAASHKVDTESIKKGSKLIAYLKRRKLRAYRIVEVRGGGDWSHGVPIT